MAPWDSGAACLTIRPPLLLQPQGSGKGSRGNPLMLMEGPSWGGFLHWAWPCPSLQPGPGTHCLLASHLAGVQLCPPHFTDTVLTFGDLYVQGDPKGALESCSSLRAAVSTVSMETAAARTPDPCIHSGSRAWVDTHEEHPVCHMFCWTALYFYKM